MIYLYKNKLPNYGNGTHYWFDSYEQYNNSLGTPFLSFSEYRFTLNGNIAEIKLPAVADYKAVTYIAWSYSGEWRYYFVNSAVYQSGYAIFSLSLDVWATYLPEVKLSNIRVARCNREIGIGVYDAIPVTTGRTFERLGDDMTANDLAMVYVVAFATGASSVLINNAGTSVGVFVNELAKLTDVDDDKKIDTIIDRVSAIINVQATVGTLDANVLKAYIVPKKVLAIKTATVPTFNIKSRTGTGTLVPDYEAAPYIFPVPFTVTIDPDKKYFAGTKLCGLELSRVTSGCVVIYNYIITQDAVQVIVQQGDRTLDITSAFEIGLTTNDGNFTTAQKIEKTLQAVGGVASGAFQIAAGGAGSVTGMLSMTNAVSAVIGTGNARYTRGGDGVSTFRKISGTGQTPYYMQVSVSINDESAKARLTGANFDTVVSGLNDIFPAALIGTGTITDTFLTATVRVSNVPADVQDYITAAFAAGIYLSEL